ncbi:kinase-like protein [Exidia glandulosa HHB12029]|uniref:Kinase-like protein n=1 Tax=Exidia glandulosa HHB12029 TaxID=1314781 RepID=A0A165QTR9_EXIGL|nr:kinase-like protein [Exidia glandulosa HHB12029]
MASPQPKVQVHSSFLPDLTGWVIDRKRIQLIAIIGRGTYGTVYRGVDLASDPRNPRFFAVKCQLRSAEPRMKLHQRREITLHQLATGHPCVVSLLNVIHTTDFMFLVMNFCPDGDLFNLLTRRNPFYGNDLLIKTAFMQLIDAVEHIHDLGIAHRDLKPENILCCGGRLLLTDFGLATDDTEGREFQCGSSFFMSPECIGEMWGRAEPFAYQPCDIWALGVIFVNIACARNPWGTATYGDDCFLQYLRDPNFLRRALPITKPLHEVLTSIFTIDPAARVTLPELRRSVARIRVFTVNHREFIIRNPSTRVATEAPPRIPRRKNGAIRIHMLSGEFDEQEPKPRREQPVPVLRVNVSAGSLGIEDAMANLGRHSTHPSIPDPVPAVAVQVRREVKRFDEYPKHMLPPSSSSMSVASVASSLGPATPEMPAVDTARAATDLDDDALDIGDGWVIPQDTGAAHQHQNLMRAKAIKQKDKASHHKWQGALKKFRKIVA